MPFFSIHFVMIFGSLCLAWGLRYGWQNGDNVALPRDWQMRWQKALVCFALPPLLVIMTAIAVLCMGSEGQMIGLQAGRLSYAIALIFLIYSIFRVGQLALNGWQSLQKLQALVVDSLDVNPVKQSMRLLNMPMLFAAQIGFWRSHLYVSQGLLDSLDADPDSTFHYDANPDPDSDHTPCLTHNRE